MKKVCLGLMALLLAGIPVMAEESMNPIITAMPSVSIAPDARAGGMGDVGVCTDADLNSQHWNPAKYAFMESQGGLTANYTPWLRKLVGDIDLAYLAGYYKITELDAIAASFTYFSMGKVSLTDFKGEFLQDAHPNELAVDVSYSRKLTEYLSAGVALRFLWSDMNNGVNATTGGYSTEMYPGWTMAADIALYGHHPIDIPLGTSYLNWGFYLSNMGGKISYDQKATQSFIPTNLRLGVGYELPFDKYNTLTFNLEVNKLMVPTMKSKFAADGEQYTRDEYSELNPAKGFFQSLCDAPGGAAEEFNEVQWCAGMEYSYDGKFFARVGYSHENQMKGNRRYATVGAGFHLSIFMLDVAYVIGTVATNPLDQTVRFTLGFDLAGIQDMIKR